MKAQLAEKAMQSAKAAEAALAGKEAIFEQMQEEVKEAQSVVKEETNSLGNARKNANAAINAVRETQQQVKFFFF